MDKKDKRQVTEIFEDIIQVIGEKDFIYLLKQLGYKLVDKEKFYKRTKLNEE